jgi:hypothetical protein
MIINLQNSIVDSSVSIGDRLFVSSSTTNISDTGETLANNMGYAGRVISIGPSYVEIDTDIPMSQGDIIAFAKDELISVSSLKGYYATVTLQNNSTQAAELFSVGSEITVSSK